jgi:hypothetical protein
MTKYSNNAVAMSGIRYTMSTMLLRGPNSLGTRLFFTLLSAWLNNILKKGGPEDWRKVLKEATGENISTRAMMDYFKPLMSWLEEQNKGRQIGWE